MTYTAAIDLSTMIWDETDFENNKKHYYNLILSFPDLLDLLKENKSYILLREELRMHILSEFPYTITDVLFQDFQRRTLSFLNQIGDRMIIYPAIDEETISVHPQLIKDHFSNEVKAEVRYLITRLHTERNPESKFFTFRYFWKDAGNLTTVDIDSLAIATINFDDEEELKKFFSESKKQFKHNPKHNLYKSGGRIAKLSCYNEREGDCAKAKYLLDTSEEVAGTFYNFDQENNVYVVFVMTDSNIYHGYDETDVNDIPNVIRKIFNK